MPRGQRGIFFECEGSKLLGTIFTAGEDPAPTAILLHGIPGIEKNHDLAHALSAAGINAVVFHYRGCWGSDGDYDIEGVPADVRACLDFLSSGSCPEVDAARLYLIGHSLGGWAALHTGSDPRVSAVVAIAAVVDPSMVEVTEEDASLFMSPWLRGVPPEGFVRQWSGATPATEAAAQVHKPLLVVHAVDDKMIPVDQAHLAFDAAPGPKDLDIHPDAGHTFIDARPWLIDLVVGWVLERAAESKGP